MTEQQTTKVPLESLMLRAAQDLSDNAYERFIQGQVTQPELKQFYTVLKTWTATSESVLDAANKIGIQI